MTDQPLMGQEEIERLLSQANNLAPPGPRPRRPRPRRTPPPPRPRARKPPSRRKTTWKTRAQAATKTTAPATTMPSAIPAAAPHGASPLSPSGDGNLASGDIEFLLNQAEQALESINAASSGDLPRGVTSYRLEEFSGSVASTQRRHARLDPRRGIGPEDRAGPHEHVPRGRAQAAQGAVVPLDKLAGDPVDVYVNGRLIARGEVLVLNDNFCVRVAELIAGVNVGS